VLADAWNDATSRHGSDDAAAGKHAGATPSGGQLRIDADGRVIAVFERPGVMGDVGPTGLEVRRALGLEPITESPIYGCMAFAEYTNGAGFCLEGVAENYSSTKAIANHLTGRQPLPALEDYVRTVTELSALRSALGSDVAEHPLYQELLDQITALAHDLHLTNTGDPTQ